MTIATGPYTPEADKGLALKGFHNLLAKVKQEPPSVLVLVSSQGETAKHLFITSLS